MRKVYLTSIIVSLLVTFGVGYAVRNYTVIPEVLPTDNGVFTYSVCHGLSGLVDTPLELTTGAPFKWRSEIIIKEIDHCTVDYDTGPGVMEYLKGYAVSWQFYANMIAVLIPLLSISWLWNRKYANNRH